MVWIHDWQGKRKSMETLLVLFPHFNFSAPDKEAYFIMLDPGDDNAMMRDNNLRYVLMTTLSEM